jgi:hypothetical protein
MTEFVQVIEWSSSRLDEIRALNDSMEREAGAGGPTRITVCADRARPGHYVSIVEFPSYDEAMRNSEDPATQDFAARMAALCDGPPTFQDLDVVHREVLTPAQRTGEAAAATAAS